MSLIKSFLPYRDADGNIPQARYVRRDSIQWVSLNSDPRDVPVEAFELRNSILYPNERGRMGQRLFIEWSTEPDWYRREHHWRPFIPKELLFDQWILPLTQK